MYLLNRAGEGFLCCDKVYLFQRLTLNLFVQVVEVPNVSWDDIGGLENVKRELQEVFLSHTLVWLLNC